MSSLSSGADGYRCFHCKQVFTDEGLAQQHFGKSPVGFPLCVKDRLAGNGGGPHDPYICIRKDELARMEAELVELRAKLIVLRKREKAYRCSYEVGVRLVRQLKREYDELLKKS